MVKFCVSVLGVGLMLACTAIGANAEEPTASKSQGQPEHPYMIGYSVGEMPVWKLKDGKPKFDASLVITYLKSLVDADSKITADERNRMLLVNASQKNHNIITRAMYPMWAFAGEPNEQLERTIDNAKKSSQKVVVFASDANSLAVKKYFDLKLSDEQPELHQALKSYLVQCISTEQKEMLEHLGIKRPVGQDATLALLDDDGKVATQVKFSELESGGKDLAASLSEFLQLHQPTFDDAREVLSSAYERAGRDQKRVLLVVSGPNCGPCVQLARFLDAKQELLAKDYVLVKLDNRMPHEYEVLAEISTSIKSIPWMAVLEPNGKVLASGDGPDGNIGYPSTEQDRAHFGKMLKETSQKLSDEETASILKGLEDF